MPVPNTTTFSLQDVQTELGGVNDDLVECFSNALSTGFDPAYEGSKNNLLNFRNYTNTPLTSFTMDKTRFASVGTACSTGSPAETLWHDGAFGNPSVGDFIYIDPAGTNAFNGQDLYHKTSANNVLEINTLGEVLSITAC
jgi:hypothetical protein